MFRWVLGSRLSLSRAILARRDHSLLFAPKKIRYQVGLVTDFDERAFTIIALSGPVACFLLPEGEAAGIQLPLLPP